MSAGRQQVRRRRTVAVILGTCLAVGGLAVAVPAVLGNGAEPDPSPPADRSTPPAPTVAVPGLECPRGRYLQSDHGSTTLATGATGARLCGAGMAGSAPPPQDLLTQGLDRLVGSVNAQPEYSSFGCMGGFGDRYLLVLGYPDGTDRRAVLDFSGCGSLTVGDVSRDNPGAPYQRFMDLLREQRRTSAPPDEVPAPVCLQVNSGFSPAADPGDMVAARMCVSYNDDFDRRTSVAVPPDDLATILDAWRDGPTTPTVKGPPCGPTTPTWVLSGVTAWGDRVQITGYCDRPSKGDDWVELSQPARQAVDRLVGLAGVHTEDGVDATTAWSLVHAWLNNVNARAVVSSPLTAAEIADLANGMWVRDPWLPDGELDWDLLGASRTDAPGWQHAWRVAARTPEGQAVFVVVRQSEDQPWRILSLAR